MTFRKLAEYFQKLEETSSRNSMVEVLARLFAEASVVEIDKVVYLTQGRVAPLYEPVEFGMADKMILKALAQAYGASLEKVTASYKKAGDLGVAAEELSKNYESRIKNYAKTVGQVFEKLQEIARAGGEGSVDRKVGLLADLLRESDPLSARYIARIPVDKMRLGFSDMTVLEGLSWMIDGTKKHKPTMEAVYNIRPDLGYIAQQVKQVERVKQVGRVFERIKPKVGTPILSMRAERLTSPTEILEKTGGECAVEPKLDGLRTQLHFARGTPAKPGVPLIKLYSRGLENVTAMYPDLVAAAQEELGVEEVILDAEAVGFDPKSGKYLPFQETVQRKRKYDVQAFSQNVPVRLIVFDCLYLNGESLIGGTYQKRREVIEKICRGKIIIPVEMEIVVRPEELEKKFEEFLKRGLEGVVAKKLDGIYQAGARGWNWIKLKGSYTGKLSDTVDAVVMGLDFGQGKRNKFGVGAFLIGVYDQKSDTYKTVSKVGTGLTDQEWSELKVKSEKLKVTKKPTNYDVNKIMACDVWVAPSIVGEFRADELTKSPMHTAGFALRFPRLVRWREKKPEDTTNLREIEEMVKLQKK